jgi:segregation and condensation protein A
MIEPDTAAPDAFDAMFPRQPGQGGDLVVDVEGFEGPLDLLLTLARSQKVDLKKISIVALADQYLTFVSEARRMRLELAADYLVMAAWLAYLKSRLLLPPPETDDKEPSGEELAARLAFQLQRLESLRAVAARLMARDRLGRDVFPRGEPEGVRIVKAPHYEAKLYDLLKAYADQRVRTAVTTIRIARAPVYRIEDARARLEAMLGKIQDWNRLDRLLPPELRLTALGRSALASSFMASLELVREGELEIRQLVPFGPVYVRAKAPEPESGAMIAPPAPETGSPEEGP